MKKYDVKISDGIAYLMYDGEILARFPNHEQALFIASGLNTMAEMYGITFESTVVNRKLKTA